MKLYILFYGFIFNLLTTSGQQVSRQLKVEHRATGETCQCLEYWDCATRGGEWFSYCGLSESEVCCHLPEDRPPDVPTFKNPCGTKGFDSGRVGVAEPSEWPWHVAIVEEPGFYYVCGGSLINTGWVLTAAHCVYPYVNESKLSLKVRAGEHDVSGSSEALPHEDRGVANIIIHPEFEPSSLKADVALLKLAFPVVRRPHIDIVCLPGLRHPLPHNKNCVLTGWGKTGENGSFSNILKELVMPVWTEEQCKSAVQRELGFSLDDDNGSFSILCAGTHGRDACQGDGGGPLVCEEEGQWFQEGIVSFGFGCDGQGRVPGVYTSVNKYYAWISQKLAKEKELQ